MSDPLPDWKTMPPAQLEARVRKLAESGYSCNVIAGHFLNASRNAVIAKIHRMEARDGKKMDRSRATSKASAKPAPANLVVPTRPRSTPKQRPTREVSEAAVVAAAQISLPGKGESFMPLPGIKPLPISELPMRTRCRWPVDVPETSIHFACGAATSSDAHVYCGPHRLIAIGRPSQRSILNGQGA